MADTYNVADLIPFGFANAISRRELVKKAMDTGLVETSVYSADRQVRLLMQKAKESGTVILHKTGGGYYQPTNEDMLQIRKYISQTKGMAFTLLKEVRAAERMLTEIGCGYKVGDGK